MAWGQLAYCLCGMSLEKLWAVLISVIVCWSARGKELYRCFRLRQMF